MHRQNRRDRAPVQPTTGSGRSPVIGRRFIASLLLALFLAACSRQVTPAVVPSTQSPAPPMTQAASPPPASPTLTTPLATPTPSATAAPTQQAECSLRPDARIEAVWQQWARGDLGCPRREAQIIPVALQEFERGLMIWKGVPELTVYVLSRGDGTRPARWTAYPDTFQEGQPGFDPLLTPPPEREQPVRGFGKVWREQPGVRDDLGWALFREHGSTGVLQVFEGGRIFLIEERRLFVLIDAGAKWQEFPVTGAAP